MAKKKKNGWDLVASQIKGAQENVARLNRHKEIMSGKGHGDLTGMSKADQTMWFNLGIAGTSDRYKRSAAGHKGRMSDQTYDNYVRKGIAREYAGRFAEATMRGSESGAYANYLAQRKKKKRIV